MPQEPEVLGLLALMLLAHSRHDARTAAGALVRLVDQDRALWNRALIAEGQSLARRCLAANVPGACQIQAAIQAVHSAARTAGETDWRRILGLYDIHMTVAPSAIVALHRAVALAEVRGAAEALALVDGLNLEDHHLFHAIRADLLIRLGRGSAAVLAFDSAIRCAANATERA